MKSLVIIPAYNEENKISETDLKYYIEILGQTALRDIERGTPLSFEMIGK